MAINILEGDGKRKYILIVLGFLAVVLVIFAIWKFVLPKNDSVQTETPAGYLNINIDFTLLKNNKIKEMKLFENIGPFSGDVGRDNPFEPANR